MIMFDKTEIIVVDDSGKRAQIVSLTYDKIVSIQFDLIETKVSLFKKGPSDAIIITIRGRETPIVFVRVRNREFFDDYMAGMEKFAKDNRITLYNKLA
jgi:hypothetical protein